MRNPLAAPAIAAALWSLAPLAFGLPGASAQSEPLEIRLSSGEGVVVMKTGRTLRGEVVRLGDELLLTLGGGGEIRIPLNSALVIAESIEEAYELRRDALLASQIDDRAALAEWCLQEGLPHRAADQVLALAKIDPRHPKLPHLERRLQSQAKAADSLAVRTVAAQNLVSHAAAASEAGDVDPRAFFDERVHSQVIFGCAAARCHGGSLKRDFQLKVFPIAVRPTGDIADANFAAVRKLVGDGGPRSAAMRYATRAHAGVNGERVRDLLVEWSRLMAADEGEPLASTAEYSAPSAPAAGGSSIRGAAFVGAPDSEIEEGNPYDPAEFNRRYHGSRTLPPVK